MSSIDLEKSHPAQGEKADWIDQFFSMTGPTYDEVVHRFTLGIDRLWKKRILKKVGESPSPKKILDLACGTGILTFALARKYPGSEVVGVDISKGYLEIARAKAEAMKIGNARFIHSRAEDFLSDDRFDAVTTSYLPKYADIALLMRNLATMLSPGGVIVFHDFTYPANRFLQMTFELYFKLIQPIGGWRYPEWKEVLIELPTVIRKTRWVFEVTAAMRREGFSEIRTESLTLQGSALVSAKGFATNALPSSNAPLLPGRGVVC